MAMRIAHGAHRPAGGHAGCRSDASATLEHRMRIDHSRKRRVSIVAAARQALIAGSVASVLSTAALALAGRRQNRSAAAPINAVSHWYWGDEALHRQGASARHTLAGYLTHHGASVFWAGAYALAAMDRPALRTPVGIAWGGLATSALACFVDFRLTPERLTPGFEHRLSRPALAGVYAAFAIGLALGAAVAQAREPRERTLRDASARRRRADRRA